MLRSFLKGGIFLAFEQYLQRGRQNCAVDTPPALAPPLAAKAAAKMLLTQQMAQEETLGYLKGLAVTVPIEEAAFSPLRFSCAVRKDGDDRDATHGSHLCQSLPCAHPGCGNRRSPRWAGSPAPAWINRWGLRAINSTPADDPGGRWRQSAAV